MVMRYLLFVCLTTFLVSCGNNSAKTEEKTEVKEKPAPVSKLDASGTAQIGDMLGAYYNVKNALVKDNADGLKTASVELNKKATEFKAFMAKDTMNGAAIAVNLDTIISFSDNIARLYPEGYVEKGRISFEKISDNMYALLKKVELKNAGVYQQYCPMAFNDKGAHWLSEEAEIKNPYFGKKMLECGEVQDSL